MGKPRSFNVELGGRTYEIPQLKIKPSADWQARVESEFDAAGNILGLMGQATGNNWGEISKQIKIAELGGALARLQGMIFQSMGRVRALVYEYAPNLAADADWIGENCYNDEVVAVFMRILRTEYPLGELARLFAGAIQRQTMLNLPSVNGESAMTAQAPTI